MTDREFEEVKKRVLEYAEKWQSLLDLSRWRLKICHHRDGKMSGSGLEAEPVAEVSTEWKYMDILVCVNSPAAGGLDDQDLEETLVHELVHSVMTDYNNAAKDGDDHEHIAEHNERVTTHLAKAYIYTMRWAYTLGMQDGAKQAKKDAKKAAKKKP